jgi:hypothetical protein
MAPVGREGIDVASVATLEAVNLDQVGEEAIAEGIEADLQGVLSCVPEIVVADHELAGYGIGLDASGHIEGGAVGPAGLQELFTGVHG